MKLLKKFLGYIFPTFGLRNSPTVKYAFSVAVILAAIFGMAGVGTSNTSYIKLSSNQSAVEQGSVFSVDIYVIANTPVNAVDLSLSFPEKQIEILGIDRGESVITLWTRDPYVEKGVIYLEGGTFKKGFIGEHKIATLKVKALLTGEAKFVTNEVKLLAGDGKGTVVPADTRNGQVVTSVYEVGSQPTVTVRGTGSIIVITDIDGDGGVTLKDISAFMANWSSGERVFDFNNDGMLTFKDFSIILADFFLKR